MKPRVGSAAADRLLTGVAIALILASACGGDSGERSAKGIVVDVQADSLTSIESFTLRTNDGEELVFGIAPDATRDPEEGFVPSHLRSHAVLAEQVKVHYRQENGQRLALRLEHQ